MDGDEVERRLIDRVADLDQARQRLQLRRRDALCGRCSHLQLALAVDAHRRAEQALQDALDEWRRSRQRPRLGRAAGGPPLDLDADGPRLKFARWLVQHGYLSEGQAT
jgi:hypothetical protein